MFYLNKPRYSELRKRKWLYSIPKIYIIGFLFAMLSISPYFLSVTVRDKIDDASDYFLAKIHKVSNKVTKSINKRRKKVDNYVSAYTQFDDLQDENARLQAIVDSYYYIATENEKLKRLLKYTMDKGRVVASTNLIIKSVDGFAETAKIPIGENKGIKEGNAVLTDGGLIGRITSVSETSAIVLLTTDPNSKVPVIFPQSKNKAVLAGDYNGELVSSFIEKEETVPSIGEIVMTSGDDGNFPPGLVVGRVSGLMKTAVKVQSVMRLSDMNTVAILDYGH